MKSGPTFFSLIFFVLCGIPLAAQNKKPLLEFGSSIRLSATGYQMTGQDNRQEPFSFFLHGSPTVSIKGFDIPVNFIFSNHHKSIQQPFNRFGITPKNKWAKVHLGYNTMQLSKYTFSNRQFLGAGVELNPGKFRFAGLYGRLQAAIREDSLDLPPATSFLSDQRIPRFERRALGGKIGIGTSLSYFDLVGMKAFDVTDDRMLADTSTLRPQENIALGIHSQLKITKQIQLKMDVASSVFTRDTTSDNYELNEGVQWIGNILQPKSSTQVLFAGEVGLGYKTTNWGVQLNYKRIDPDFKSMGIYYLQTDISQWSVAPNFTLLNKTLRVRANIGIQKNNLYNTRLATNKRGIQSANLQWNPNAFFQMGAFFSNFGLTQTPGLKQLTDSTRISQVNSSYGLSPMLSWSGTTWRHQVFSTISVSKLSFNKSAINPIDDVQTAQFNGQYTLTPKKDNRFSVGGIFTWLKSDFGETQSVNTGFGSTGSLHDPKGRWSATAAVQYFFNSLDEIKNGNSIVINTDIQYQLKKALQFFLLGQFIRNNTGLDESTFTEKQMTVGLQFQF